MTTKTTTKTTTREAFFVSSEEEEEEEDAVNATTTTIGALVAKFREKDDVEEDDVGRKTNLHTKERTDGGGKEYDETLRERMNRSFWWRGEGEEGREVGWLGGGGGGRASRPATGEPRCKKQREQKFQYNHQERQLFAPDERRRRRKRKTYILEFGDDADTRAN